jgi:hypothetical protein
LLFEWVESAYCAGKTAYYMSKCGMTMVALGAAAEVGRCRLNQVDA